MTSDVTNLKARLHSKKFASEYPRYVPDDRTLHEISSSNVDVLKYVTPIDGLVFCAMTSPPKLRYVVAKEIDLESVLPKFNQLLIYRILRGLYGAPDILSEYLDRSKGSRIPVDWGFSFSVPEGIIGEVRNRYMSRVYLSFWMPRAPKSIHGRKILGAAMAKCLGSFIEAIEKNLHFWDEKEDLRTFTSYECLNNVPAQRYKGGELLLEKAKEFDLRPNRKALDVGEKLPLQSVGYLYLSAATLFVVHLESFINVLYRLLLRQELRTQLYDRLTVHDVDIRLSAMHLFCQGFVAQAIEPRSELWERLNQLRKFRNDIVHGNITDEHCIHFIREDTFAFYYAPAVDFRGRHSEKTIPETLTRFQPRVDERTVRTTKKTVDDIRDSILRAMDAPTRDWVQSWLWQPFILPREI